MAPAPAEGRPGSGGNPGSGGQPKPVALFHLQDIRFLSVFSIPAVRILQGRTTVIRGPSGSGKSTVLRLLNGMTRAEAGEVRYRGEPLSALDPVALRREVVMLGQQPVVFTDSIREDALVGCRFTFGEAPLPGDEAIRQALKAVRLEQPLEGDPTVLSGGEQQRLALARVLLMDPPVLLLDEPSSGLDQETEEAVFALIRQRREAGKTVVVATHARSMDQLGEVDTFTFTEGVLR